MTRVHFHGPSIWLRLQSELEMLVVQKVGRRMPHAAGPTARMAFDPTKPPLSPLKPA
jgi:hypothetical protein